LFDRGPVHHVVDGDATMKAGNIFGRDDILARGEQRRCREQLGEKYDGPLKGATPRQSHHAAETPN
jgi:hypothetical protein